VQVGITLGADMRRMTEVARWAEGAGYDQVACGEHLFFHVPTPNAFIALSAAAGATERVRLLSALTLVPQYPAALLAKLVSGLDAVSNGRFDFGVGVGGEFPPEFVAAGVDVRTRGARTDESLDVLARLLGGSKVDFAGRWVEIPGLALRPPPVQQPGPPVWVGGRKPAARRRAGQFGDVWMPYLCTPEQLASGLAEVAAAHGREGRVRGAVFAWGAVHPDREHAVRRATEVVGTVYRQDFTGLADRYLLAGTPDDVLRRLRSYHEAGCAHVVFCPAASAGTEWMEMAQLFADEVAPVVRGWSA
jgi:alkanesulfonate monooxygenase SsuD/methylene tetrahydromethanopterin reductase-like flavin-dependent oxidoreductase (luciferase family)